MVEGHSVEEDGLTWTLKLRDGLRFHNKEPVLARDVVASIERFAPRVIFAAALMDATDELSALDDRTVRFRLKRPFPHLPEALAGPGGNVPAHPADPGIDRRWLSWCHLLPAHIDKIMRLNAQTALIENGFVYIPETAPWLAEYLHEMTLFPKGKHDDQVDSTAQFLDWFKKPMPRWGIYEFYRQQAEALAAAARGEELKPLKDQPLDLVEVYRRAREYFDCGQHTVGHP